MLTLLLFACVSVREPLLLLGPLLLLRHHHRGILAGAPGQKDTPPGRPGRIFPPQRRATGRAGGQSAKLPAASPAPWRRLWEGGLTARLRPPGPSQAPRGPQAQLCAPHSCQHQFSETVCVGTRVRKSIVNSMRLQPRHALPNLV